MPTVSVMPWTAQDGIVPWWPKDPARWPDEKREEQPLLKP